MRPCEQRQHCRQRQHAHLSGNGVAVGALRRRHDVRVLGDVIVWDAFVPSRGRRDGRGAVNWAFVAVPARLPVLRQDRPGKKRRARTARDGHRGARWPSPQASSSVHRNVSPDGSLLLWLAKAEPSASRNSCGLDGLHAPCCGRTPRVKRLYKRAGGTAPTTAGVTQARKPSAVSIDHEGTASGLGRGVKRMALRGER